MKPLFFHSKIGFEKSGVENASLRRSVWDDIYWNLFAGFVGQNIRATYVKKREPVDWSKPNRVAQFGESAAFQKTNLLRSGRIFTNDPWLRSDDRKFSNRKG